MSRCRYRWDRPGDVHSQARSAPYRYVARELENVIARFAVPAATAGSKVLDYGCAARPYRALFGAGIEYVGADLEGNSLADVQLNDDGSVPLPDAQFDLRRWTSAGLGRILEAAGLRSVEIRGIMGLAPAAVQLWPEG